MYVFCYIYKVILLFLYFLINKKIWIIKIISASTWINDEMANSESSNNKNKNQTKKLNFSDQTK